MAGILFPQKKKEAVLQTGVEAHLHPLAHVLQG